MAAPGASLVNNRAPLRRALHRRGRLVLADVLGNLWTYRNCIGCAAKQPKGDPMRTQTDIESNARRAAEHAAQRTLQAAQLLQDALALLRADSTMPVAHTMKCPPDRLLRLPEVERLTGLRRSAIYEQMRRGIFPRSVKAGQRTAAWPESAVQSWIAERMNGRMT